MSANPQAASRSRKGRPSLSFLLVSVLAFTITSVGAEAQSSLASRVLVVYNSSVPDSLAVANHYIAQRGIPSANLCAVAPPSTTSLTWTQYVSTIKTPVKNCLNGIGANNILYIVFSYDTPYLVTGSSGLNFYALDQYVADIWDQYATSDFYPYPTHFQPYYDDAQSEGNVYVDFVPFSDYRAQNGALTIYSVWRLDAASAALASGLVDKAIAAEAAGLTGHACLDRNRGNMALVQDSDYGEGEWDLHQAATFAGLASFGVTEDSNNAEFGTPPAPNCPNAALYSGWYSYDHYNDAFTWNIGAIGWHLDSASAANPRGGTNWSANAVIKGITSTTGAVNEPFLQGLVRPGGTFRDLFQGANVGDAFLRNTRWLKWMILNIGDPLYRPFPNGLSPFNPPPPQASLAIAQRYVVNGASSSATVTLAQPAPAGGTLVPLSSSNTNLAQVPQSVTVQQGNRSAAFTINTSASPQVTLDTPVTITASGVGQNTLTVSPLLGGQFISPNSIIGGAPTTGLLVLNAPAPVGGATVSLSDNNPAVIVPASVTIPQGASQATVTINSSSVSAFVATTVTAKLHGASIGTTLMLQPALRTLTISPSTVQGTAPASAIIVLGAKAPPAGWQVDLKSSNASVASVPNSVLVPAGTSSITVPITTYPQCSNQSVTITASSGVTSLNATLTVTPPAVSNLNFPATTKGGNSVTATVYLAHSACQAGLPVALSSSNPAVASVPANVTVAGGQTTANFIITTTQVTATTSVVISATSDNVTKTRTLSVTP